MSLTTCVGRTELTKLERDETATEKSTVWSISTQEYLERPEALIA